MQKLINGLHKFRSEVFCSKEDLFLRLAKGQQPDALFITCSDSRVNPNLITQTEPGDLFILRNAGNIVPPYSYGSSEAGTIEFAVAGLGVKHIIVCGHTLCGAMKGLLDPRLVENTPAVKSWLDYAESTRRLIRENYGHLTGTDLLNATIEENVLAQVECIRTHRRSGRASPGARSASMPGSTRWRRERSSSTRAAAGSSCRSPITIHRPGWSPARSLTRRRSDQPRFKVYDSCSEKRAVQTLSGALP